jgi:hypothetical protein
MTHLIMKECNKTKIMDLLQAEIHQRKQEAIIEMQNGSTYFEHKLDELYFIQEQLNHLKEYYLDESYNNFFQINGINNGLENTIQTIINTLYHFPLIKSSEQKREIAADVIMDYFCVENLELPKKTINLLRRNTKIITDGNDVYFEVETGKLPTTTLYQVINYFKAFQGNVKTYLEERLQEILNEAIYI